MNKNMTKAQIAAENETLRSQLENQRHEIIRLREENEEFRLELDRAQDEILDLRSKREAAPTPKALLEEAKSYAMQNHVLTRVHQGRVQSFNHGVWRNV